MPAARRARIRLHTPQTIPFSPRFDVIFTGKIQFFGLFLHNEPNSFYSSTYSFQNICATFRWVRLAEMLFYIERSPPNQLLCRCSVRCPQRIRLIAPRSIVGAPFRARPGYRSPSAPSSIDHFPSAILIAILPPLTHPVQPIISISDIHQPLAGLPASGVVYPPQEGLPAVAGGTRGGWPVSVKSSAGFVAAAL